MIKLPHPEESGERCCIRRIQEFLINEMSSAKCGAILPEDKLTMTGGGCKYSMFLSTDFLQTRVCLFIASNSFTNSSLHFIIFHIYFVGT